MLKQLFKTRYRVKHDWFEYPQWYMIQKRYWFSPFWFEVAGLLTIEQAQARLARIKQLEELNSHDYS